MKFFLFFLIMMIMKASYGTNTTLQDFGSDTMLPGQYLLDSQFLDSASKIHRLQFFSPNNSRHRYLGIFYDRRPHPVWVANRNNPIPDASGKLIMDTDGLLKISYTRGSLDIPGMTASIGDNTSATLRDTGNLVVGKLSLDGTIKQTLWESFDYPTDTLFPGMKLGINLKTGRRWSLTSWISDQIPAEGSFTLGIDPNGTNNLIMWWRGSIYWTGGAFSNGWFENLSKISSVSSFSYAVNGDERLFRYSLTYGNSRLSLNQFGEIQGAEVLNDCPRPRRFAEGCVWKELPDCRIKEGNFSFLRRDNKSPFEGESYIFSENLNMSLFDCQMKCLENCSCVAFGSITEDGTGCEIWTSSVQVGWDPLSNKRVLYTLLHEKTTGFRDDSCQFSAIRGSLVQFSLQCDHSCQFSEIRGPYVRRSLILNRNCCCCIILVSLTILQKYYVDHPAHIMGFTLYP